MIVPRSLLVLRHFFEDIGDRDLTTEDREILMVLVLDWRRC